MTVRKSMIKKQTKKLNKHVTKSKIEIQGKIYNR